MKYRVSLCYTGYTDFIVDAGTEAEAFEIAENQSGGGPYEVSGLMRWKEADMIEAAENDG